MNAYASNPLAALALALFASTAHAALFDDDEARKRIADTQRAARPDPGPARGAPDRSSSSS